MNLANKSFRDNRTGEVVRVIDSFENIAILENKTKVDTRRLLDNNFYTEYIDPSSFLESTTNSAYNSLFETIKSIPTTGMPIDDTEMRIDVTGLGTGAENFRPNVEQPVVYESSVEDEKAELARKYGVSIDSTSAQSRQNQAFAKILGEGAEQELPPVPKVVENVQRVEVVRDEEGTVVTSEYVSPETVASKPVVQKDPYEMFRGIKRGVEFKLDLPLTNRIPKLQFIEMMEESYDKSIIEFLAHDITEEILRDPDSLRRSIESKIREMVYGVEEKVEEPVKKAAPKRTPKPNTAQGEKPGYKKPTRTRAKKETEKQ